jgi:hypothetical protein
LTSTNETFKSAKDLIAKHFEKSVEKHTSYIITEEDDNSFFLRPLQCDMIVFLSILPSDGITPDDLALYESEMRYPTGQRIARPPPMELSGVMYSPDCGTALEWRDERAVKVEKFWHAGRTVGIVAGLVSGLQCWWVLKEMGERGSPSVISSRLVLLILERKQSVVLDGGNASFDEWIFMRNISSHSNPLG